MRFGKDKKDWEFPYNAIHVFENTSRRSLDIYFIMKPFL